LQKSQSDLPKSHSATLGRVILLQTPGGLRRGVRNMVHFKGKPSQRDLMHASKDNSHQSVGAAESLIGGQPGNRLPRDFRLSVAIPVYNEESNLTELYRRIRNVLDQVAGGPHEIVFVDDGSTDGTPEMLGGLAIADPNVTAVLLSRNFGHQAALSAALDHVHGDAVVLMDGDLQDTPETIPRFLQMYQRGFDVVYAVREKRKEAWWLKACYAGFYRLIRQLSELDLPEGSGDFALLSRRVVERMRAMPERHRYLRGMRHWVGYRQTGISVEREARHSGASKYSFAKLFQLAFDGIFSFSVKPLRAAAVIGMLAIAASMTFVAYAIMAHLFFSRSPQGFTALVTIMTLLTGIQLVFLGAIGEYVGRIYEQVKLRPMYVVDRVLTAETTDLDQLATSSFAVSTPTVNPLRQPFPGLDCTPQVGTPNAPIG
jgi:dolichol-phosphate mannosyltransferase